MATVISNEGNAKLASLPATFTTRAALNAGCDMVLVCNDRPAARATVATLRDYSNPLSLVRLARLHGTGHLLRETLLASDEWQAAAQRLNRWCERPQLVL